jgi:hypothetical protein
MTHTTMKWLNWAAVAGAAAALAGCNDGTSTTAPTPPPNQGVTFSVFTNQLFYGNANATPVQINNIDFDFDVNDTPNAFQGLITAGMF